MLRLPSVLGEGSAAQCGNITVPAHSAATAGRHTTPKGRGLNSIPLRFALLAALVVVPTLWAQAIVVSRYQAGDLAAPLAATLLALCVALPTLAIYLAGRRLAGNIIKLQRSTEAIIAGRGDRLASLDCDCEVGGLADSFRAMVDRMNDTILRMNSLAYTDSVTGLPNRSIVMHALNLLARQRDGGCAIMFIDLDGFKAVNDRHGHDAGDDLLREVAERIISGCLRLERADVETGLTPLGDLRHAPPERPIIARFAGDEFVVVLPGKSAVSELERCARSLCAAVAMPFNLCGDEARVSASIGIARMPDDTRDVDRLLTCADLAMYAAKQAGGDRVEFYTPRLSDLAVHRLEIGADLRRAIENDELLLQYQPKIDSRNLSVRGFEALVRWRHPRRGMVAPNEFIEVAEAAGLMQALGMCVIRMAAVQCRRWIESGTPRRLSVNVSPSQFAHSGFVQAFLDILRRNEVPPHFFEIEITENMAMQDANFAQDRLGEIRSAGVEIAIDDFGTGYSNLSQLSRLPLDLIKIDRSLIKDCAQSLKAQQIIRAIVAMAHAMGHRVVAEGIEVVEQYVFLKAAGCDEIQGFLFGRPMDADDVGCWERERTFAGLEAGRGRVARSGLRRAG